MEENIFNSIDSRDASFETQLNIMHTTYLVIQCSLDSSAPIARGYEVFQALHSEYCGPGAKVFYFLPMTKMQLLLHQFILLDQPKVCACFGVLYWNI